MKKIVYIAFYAASAIGANAQVKIGASPTTIVSGAKLQVDGDATTTAANPAKLIVVGGGNIGMGTSNPTHILDIVATAGPGTDYVVLTSYSGSTASATPLYRSQAASGTLSSPGFIPNGFRFGGFGAGAYNGSGFTNLGSVAMWSTEAHSASGLGTAVTFNTTANGTTSNTEKMRLDNNGNLGIATTGPAKILDIVTASGNDYIQLTSYGGTSSTGVDVNGFPTLALNAASGSTTAIAPITGVGTRYGGLFIQAYTGGSSGTAREGRFTNGFQTAAAISFRTTETHSATAIGTAICFSTATNGTTTTTEKVRIDNNGYVGIGITNPTAPLVVYHIGDVTYANDAAAGTAGLAKGALWVDASGVVHAKQ